MWGAAVLIFAATMFHCGVLFERYSSQQASNSLRKSITFDFDPHENDITIGLQPDLPSAQYNSTPTQDPMMQSTFSDPTGNQLALCILMVTLEYAEWAWTASLISKNISVFFLVDSIVNESWALNPDGIHILSIDPARSISEGKSDEIESGYSDLFGQKIKSLC